MLGLILFGCPSLLHQPCFAGIINGGPCLHGWRATAVSSALQAAAADAVQLKQVVADRQAVAAHQAALQAQLDVLQR